MSHTREPWELDEDDPVMVYIPHSKFPYWVRVLPEDSEVADQEDYDNARLIVTAPDLLAAAEKVIACGAMPRERHLCEAINELKAAVEKAKGD